MPVAYRADTIVACATPPGRGAIAVVRCSGRDALAIAGRVFRPAKSGPLEPWRFRRGTALAADGLTPLDDVLAVHFPAPHSYTGEDSFELHCHGAPVVVEQILASMMAAGARGAERGEFTRRAVLNGKIDLLQAEAVADLVDARMAAGARAAWAQLQGALSGELLALRSSLVGVLADIEAQVDFTDDDLPEFDFGRRVAAIVAVEKRIVELLGGFAASRRQREGLRVVVTGKPNAGKSSLVNGLLGTGRMIVSDEPGTTRDLVEEAVDLSGIAFVLVDTAGIRDTDSKAEIEAVARARDSVGEADLLVLVVDSSVAAEDEDLRFWRTVLGPDTIVAFNKADLAAGLDAQHRSMLIDGAAAAVETCGRRSGGCSDLTAALCRLGASRIEAEPVGISRARHRVALERTLGPLGRARELAMTEQACELAAFELRTALAELAGISDDLGSEEVLDRIFSEFCIGK